MKVKLGEKILIGFVLLFGCSSFYSWQVESVSAASKTSSWSVEDKERVQYHELQLPIDFSKVDSIQTNTGSVMNYTVDEVNKKLKVTVGSGTRSRNEYQYSGSTTGSGGASAGQYMSAGFITWYSIDNNPPIYNVQMRYKYRDSPDWSNWVGAGSQCFSEDTSTGQWSSCYYGMSYYVEYYDTVAVEFRAATARTTTTFYQYDITLNYSTNSAPTIISTTPTNQLLSDVTGSNKLAISGTVKDADVANALSVKYTIDGTTHIGKALQNLTANGGSQAFSGNVTIDSTIPAGTRTLRVWVEDNKGGKSAEQTLTFVVDKTKPTGTLTANSSTWTNGNIVVTATGSDTGGSGFKRIKKPDGSYVNGASTTHTVSANGTYEFVFEDGVGNTFSKSIAVSNIDKQIPLILFTPEEIEGVFTDIEVQIDIVDKGLSGFKQSRYVWSKEQTKPTTGWSNWATENQPLLVQKKEGKWYLHIEAEDVTGNRAYAMSGIYEKIMLSPSITLTVSPAPTGIWANQFMDVYVMESGDAKVLANATKTYEVTNTSATPSNLTKPLPTTKKITLNLIGENFLHVQYVLENGTKMTSTSGPYLIDTSSVGTFEMKLTNASGATITTWGKDALKLVIGNPTTPSVSGYQKQYRIEGYHNEWQAYREGMTINLEGQHRIFGRVVNGTGQVSEQKMVVAKMDFTPPIASQYRLSIKDNNRYEVSVQATDSSSGVKEVLLNDGTVLTKNGQNYTSNALTKRPTSSTVKDYAGNATAAVSFEAEPVITFGGGYTLTASDYRGDVVVTMTGATRYLIGSKEYLCAQNPCQATIQSNSTLTVIRENGVSETRKTVVLSNLDKTPLFLAFNGKRNALNPMKLEFEWNLSLTNGRLVCLEGGTEKTYIVNGKTHAFIGKNIPYDCVINATYKGESIKSNRIKLFTDSNAATDGGAVVKEVPKTTNVHIDQMATGDGYMINAKSDNYKSSLLPFPQDVFVP